MIRVSEYLRSVSDLRSHSRIYAVYDKFEVDVRSNETVKIRFILNRNIVLEEYFKSSITQER